MKLFFLSCLAILSFSFHALAQDGRVENVTVKIYKNLENGQYEKVEQDFNAYMENGIKTRHGTDITLAIIDGLIEKVDADETHEKWDAILSEWNRNRPSSFIQEFISYRSKHAEAAFFTQEGRSEDLMQSQRRRYKDLMSNSYNRYLRIIKDFPNEWRIHAYLAKHYDEYKLTQAELNQHFLATQTMKKGEVSSMEGYIAAMSPYALGRDDKTISQGISNIIKKYPDRNLTKPEYIDDVTKQEIEDEIFELAINKMLINARQYADQADIKSTAPMLIPMAYSIIYKDINKHYEGRPDKIEKHPLSYKRKAVWQEIERNFKRLIQRYPNSGKYLSEYLRISLESGESGQILAIINTIMKNDPGYNPYELAPIQCDYFSQRLKSDNSDTTRKQMYSACKNALTYAPKETFYYRVGWAARQDGEFDQSNIFLEKASELAPDNPAYLTDMCWNYKDLKQYDKALDLCDRAIAIDRKFARAWLGRSHINYYGFNNLAQSQKDSKIYKSLTTQESNQ